MVLKKTKKKIYILLIVILIIALLIAFRVPEKVLKIIYPLKYDNYVETYSEKYNVDKYLIYAIIKAENNFDNHAVSSKEAKGLMQLMKNTAKDITKKLELKIQDDEIENRLLDSEFNINLGTKYISILLEKYNSVELALIAYNAGSGNVDTWLENGTLKSDGSNVEEVPYKETNSYVRKILRDYDIYKNLYN